MENKNSVNTRDMQPPTRKILMDVKKLIFLGVFSSKKNTNVAMGTANAPTTIRPGNALIFSKKPAQT